MTPRNPATSTSDRTEAAQEKRRLRQMMKRLRASIPPMEKQSMDARFQDLFLRLPELEKASAVYSYISYSTEPDTCSLISTLLARGISVAAPRVTGEQVEFFWIRGMEDLQAGYRGILEPGPHCERAEETQAMVLTPGLAFTAAGQRLGYGGGFYDRFFAREPGHVRAAFSYPFQLVETLPTDPFDQNIQQIILPDRVIDAETRRT